MKQIRKFLQLSRPDRSLLIQTFFMLAIVTSGLRILPWLALQRPLLKLADRNSRFHSSRRPSVQRISWAIRASWRYIPKATCLPQALVAQFLLISHAYPADLQLGAAKDKNGKLEAHAWVTSDNQIIIGDMRDLERFVQLSPMEGQTIQDYGRTY
jgi:hypothetical protein